MEESASDVNGTTSSDGSRGIIALGDDNNVFLDLDEIGTNAYVVDVAAGHSSNAIIAARADIFVRLWWVTIVIEIL